MKRIILDRGKLKLFSVCGGMSLAFTGIGYVYYKFIPKISLKNYRELCLYIAVMDDEICRNELEGTFMEGREIIFPPRRETLQYRYHLFLEMYKTYSRKRLEKEVVTLEKRLAESRQQYVIE